MARLLFLFFPIILLIPLSVIAQFSQPDSGHYQNISSRSFILPATLITSGLILFDSKLNKKLQPGFRPDDPNKKIRFDNFTQYAPAAITIGLEALGVKGRHDGLQTTILYAMSNILLNAVVIPTKQLSRELRPDSSDYFSFPSGHTSEAFASAELMRLEYGHKYPWISVTGYLLACTTGYLRIYNNKHWISDVIAGAGIGVASTRLAYYLYENYQSKRMRNKLSHFDGKF